MRKILFISPYPHDSAGSQRFRFEQYFDDLTTNGFIYKQVPFLDKKTWNIFYKEGRILQKIWGMAKGISRRVYCILVAMKYDLIYIHREAAPIGPPVIEYIISKILKKKIIFDFDDSIWLHDTSTSNTTLRKFKSSEKKTEKIIRYSYKVFAGNEYLANYAKQYNTNVVIVPTIVDTEYHRRQETPPIDKLCIGWTGTHTTLKHFESFMPILEKIYSKYSDRIYFKLIANKSVEYPTLNLTSTLWNKGNEIEQLSEFDIGIMPLPNDKWSNGKCGFKAIQYMALGIPPMISPVGVNIVLVDSGINGLICDKEEDWLKGFELLIFNEQRRIEMGKLARKKIISEFSLISTRENFITNLN